MTKLSRQEIERIILLAANKFSKKQELLNDRNKLQLAMDYFQENSANVADPVQLANIALLGVMTAYQVSGIVPVVRYSPGNPTGVPVVTPETGGSGGGSALDQIKRVDFKFGDPLGVEAQTIANLLESGEFSEDFIEQLERSGFFVHPPTLGHSH